MKKMKFMSIQMITLLVLASVVFAYGSSEQSGSSSPGVSEPIEAILPPDLSNYPDMFVKNGNFDAVIVVGDKAPASDAIAQSNLASFFVSYLGKSMVGSTKLSSELDTLEQNIISIGSACHNNASFRIMSYPKQCDMWLEPGKAMILLYGYKDYVYMVVAGYSDKGTRDAVDFLINQKKGSLKGSNLLIDTNEIISDSGKQALKERDIKEKIENTSIELEKEKEKIISELNERIAKSTEDASKKAITPAINAAINNTTEKTLGNHSEQTIRREQKKEAGIIKSLIDWFKKLFS